MHKNEPLPAFGTEMDLASMAAHAQEAALLLRTLANPNRLMILCALAESEFSVGELNGRVPLSQSALSQHLALLRNDGLVTTRRVAQSIYYSLCEGPALRVIRTLHDIYCDPARQGLHQR
jgi:ArsR family transcriptional regulator, virulence genes transcriptional regulator